MDGNGKKCGEDRRSVSEKRDPTDMGSFVVLFFWLWPVQRGLPASVSGWLACLCGKGFVRWEGKKRGGCLGAVA